MNYKVAEEGAMNYKVAEEGAMNYKVAEKTEPGEKMMRLKNMFCFLSNRRSIKERLLNAVRLSGDLDQHLSCLQLAKISKFIKGWEPKAYLLGLTEVEIEDIKQDNQSNEMRRVAMLRKWASKFGDKATLRTLIEVSVENNWISFITSVCSSLGYLNKNTGYGKRHYIKAGLYVSLLVLLVAYILFMPDTNFITFTSTLPIIQQNFYGRDGDMNYLVNLLDFSNDTVRLINIVGPPGFGKSALAINVGHKMLAKGDVYYINLMDFSGQNFKQVLAERTLFDKMKNATFDNLIDWGRNKWWRRNRLIILDNCDDIILYQKENFHDAIDKLLQYSDGNLKLITTSREILLHFDDQIVKYKVNPIDSESAYKVLEFKSPSRLNNYEKQTIADLTGRVPLALKIVGAILSDEMNSASEIIEQLKNQPIDALSPPDLRSSKQLSASISLSYKHLDSNTQNVGHYLSIFSGSFDKQTAEGILHHLIEKNCISKVYLSLKTLVRFSLVEFDGQLQRFYFHKLIKDFFNTSNSVTNRLHFFHGMKLYYSQELCTMTREFQKSPQKALHKLDLDRHHIKLLMSMINSNKIEVQSNLDFSLAECFLESLENQFTNCRFPPQEIISVLQSFTTSFAKSLKNNFRCNKSKKAVSIFSLYVYLTLELCDILRENLQRKEALKVIESSTEIVKVFCKYFRAEKACTDFYVSILVHYEEKVDVDRAKNYLITTYLEQHKICQVKCELTCSMTCHYLDIAKVYYILKDYEKAAVFFEKALYNDILLSIHQRVPIMLFLRKNLTILVDIQRIENDLKQYYNKLLKLSSFEMSRLATPYITSYQDFLNEIGEPDKAHAIQDSWIQAMEQIGVIDGHTQFAVATRAAKQLSQAGEYNRSASILKMTLSYIDDRSLSLDYANLNIGRGAVMYYMNNFTESKKAFLSAIKHMIASNFTYDSYSSICSILIFKFFNSDYLIVCLMGGLKSSAHYFGSGFLYVLLKSPFDYVPVKSQNTSAEMKAPLGYFPSLLQHSHGADLVNEAGGVFPFKSVNKIAASMLLEYILTIIHNNCIYLFESNTLRCFCNFISILVRLMILGDIIHLICLLFGVYYNIFQEAFNFLILVLLVKFKCSWCFY